MILVLGVYLLFLRLMLSLCSSMASQYLGMCSLVCGMSLGCSLWNLFLLLSQSCLSTYLGVVSQ